MGKYRKAHLSYYASTYNSVETNQLENELILVLLILNRCQSIVDRISAGPFVWTDAKSAIIIIIIIIIRFVKRQNVKRLPWR